MELKLGWAPALFYGHLVVLLLITRLWLVLPQRVKSRGKARRHLRGSSKGDGQQRLRTSPVRTLVVLGSGGHTKEMLTLLRELDRSRYTPTYFIRAESDTRSEGMVRSGGGFVPNAIITIPRSRHVGQSWLTTPLTTIYALMGSVTAVVKHMPDLIICNGPGTCIPVCMVGFLLRFLGIRYTKIIFVESLCRVQSLSLSGKLLYYLADRFVVQWPQLAKRYDLAEYIGQIC